MARLLWLTWTVASLLVTQVAAQTTDDLVGFFVSEAVSVYNGVTSAVGSFQAAASAAAASSSDVAASASSGVSDDASLLVASDFSSPSSTSSFLDLSSIFPSASAVGTSSALTTARSGSAAAASETSSAATASASHNGGGGNKNLPIILGCVLGALALGLFILALLLCFRRRSRHRNEATRARALSPDDHEVESWKRPSGSYHSRHDSSKELLAAGAIAGAGAGAAPGMSEHPAFRDHQQHENPFVPVPPPPRKSAPNARAGLTDGTVAGDVPYLMEKDTGRPVGRKSEESSHIGRNLAMGAGGLALGAAAVHHREKKNERGFEVNNPYNRPSSISRKPVPVNDDLNHRLWATPSTTANDASFALSNAGGRRSSESARSKRASRDPARANTAFNTQYAPVPDQDNKDHHGASTAVPSAAAVLGGVALANNHHSSHGTSRSRTSSRSRGASRSRGNSRSRSHSQSPHRSLLLDAKDYVLNDTSRNSDTLTPSHFKVHTDAVPQHDEMSGGIVPTNAAPPTYATQGPFDVPPAPQTRSRRNSPLGMAAPAAAALSYIGTDHRDRPRERSTSQIQSYPHSPDDYTRTPSPGLANLSMMPSRTPDRRSFPEHRHYSPLHTEPFPSMHESPSSNLGPLSSSVHSAMSPYPSPPPSEIQAQIQPHHFRLSGTPSSPHTLLTGEGVSTPGVHPLHTSTGIVGDDRYPHMNIPRRKSGGEYDYENDAQFLPQVLPLPPGAARDSRSRSRSNSMSGSVNGVGPSAPSGDKLGHPKFPVAEASETSDDSAWRLSMGMPGGWQRTRSQSPANPSRKSYESARSPVSAMDSYDQRDSNLSGSTAVTGGNGGRRLRLADLRKEEEELMRREGRKSMESEWVGSSGYGGYDERYGGQRYYDGQHGVGVAR